MDPTASPPWPASPVPSTSGPCLPSPRLGWEAGRRKDWPPAGGRCARCSGTEVARKVLRQDAEPSIPTVKPKGHSRPSSRHLAPSSGRQVLPPAASSPPPPWLSPLILSQGGTSVTWSLAAAKPAAPSAGRGRGCKQGIGNGAFPIPATAGPEKGTWELQGRLHVPHLHSRHPSGWRPLPQPPPSTAA